MKKAYVYFIQMENTNFIKIGVSYNWKQRLSELQIGNPIHLHCIEWMEFDSMKEARKMETTMHHEFAHCGKRGEWFEFSLDDYMLMDWFCGENDHQRMMKVG